MYGAAHTPPNCFLVLTTNEYEHFLKLVVDSLVRTLDLFLKLIK